MTVTIDHIRETLDDYLGAYPQDKEGLGTLLELLDTSADLASRKEFRGHVTAGAVLADPAGRVLQVKHVALNRCTAGAGRGDGHSGRCHHSGRALSRAHRRPPHPGQPCQG